MLSMPPPASYRTPCNVLRTAMEPHRKASIKTEMLIIISTAILYVLDIASRDLTQLGMFYNALRCCIFIVTTHLEVREPHKQSAKDALVTS